MYIYLYDPGYEVMRNFNKVPWTFLCFVSCHFIMRQDLHGDSKTTPGMTTLRTTTPGSTTPMDNYPQGQLPLLL